MKRILVLILFACCGSLAYAQSGARKAILSTMAAQEAAWNRGDLVGFMDGYWVSDSLCFIGSRGMTYSWQATLDNYRRAYPDEDRMGRLQFTILKVERLSRRHAYVIGRWRLTRTAGDLEGHFTLLWKKIEGRWVIVADHSS